MSKTKVDHESVFGDLLGDLKETAGTFEQRDIPLDQIVFNHNQPRKHIDEEALENLTTSIKDKGVLEPILVRRVGESYEVVAGERRTRAAAAAGLASVPAIIRDMDADQAFEVAIIENLQREDLNPVEETDAVLRLLSMQLERPTSDILEGIRSLYDEARGRTGNTRISKSERERIVGIFEALGRFTPSSFHINRVPILSLPPELLNAVRRGELNYPKAKVLARVKGEEEQAKLLKKAVAEQLSRQEVTDLVKREEDKPEPQDEVYGHLKRVRTSLTLKRVNALDDKKQKRVKKLLSELERLLK